MTHTPFIDSLFGAAVALGAAGLDISSRPKFDNLLGAEYNFPFIRSVDPATALGRELVKPRDIYPSYARASAERTGTVPCVGRMNAGTAARNSEYAIY